MGVDITGLTGGTILTASLAGGVVDPNLQATVQALAQQMATAMPWIPYDPVGVMGLAMSQGSYPYPIQTPAAPIPAWLNTPANIAAWRQMAGAWVPITQAVLTGQLAQAVAAGQALANNVAFWNSLSVAVAVVVPGAALLSAGVTAAAGAVQDAWNDFWAALAQFKKDRDAANTAIGVARSILANPTYANRVPADLAQTNTSLASQVSSLSSTVSTALTPLGSQVRSAAGLGAIPLIIAGVAVAAVASAAAVVWHYESEMAAISTHANDNATAVIAAKNAADEADFNAGKITEVQLEARRQQTDADAAKLLGGSSWKTWLYVAGAGLGIVGLILLIRRIRAARAA